MQGWKDVPLAAMLSAALGCPARLVNDADAALLAECWVGAAAGKRHGECGSLEAYRGFRVEMMA